MWFKVLLSLIIILVLTSCAGKDTVVGFSNADIQIMKFYDPDKHPSEMKSLFVVSTQKTIEVNVYSYKEQNGYIYTSGETGFTKLNAKTLDFTQSKKLNDFSSEDVEIFNMLTK